MLMTKAMKKAIDEAYERGYELGYSEQAHDAYCKGYEAGKKEQLVEFYEDEKRRLGQVYEWAYQLGSEDALAKHGIVEIENIEEETKGEENE